MSNEFVQFETGDNELVIARRSSIDHVVVKTDEEIRWSYIQVALPTETGDAHKLEVDTGWVAKTGRNVVSSEHGDTVEGSVQTRVTGVRVVRVGLPGGVYDTSLGFESVGDALRWVEGSDEVVLPPPTN